MNEYDKPLANQHGDGAYDLAPTEGSIEGSAGLRGLSGDTACSNGANLPHAERPGLPTAGRALDALVAEKVFGWTRMSTYESRPGEWISHGFPPGEYKPFGDVPSHYSTDIAAAWTILKFIRENWIFSKRGRFFDALKQETRLTDGTSIAWPAALIAWQDSFPEKLCRAAITTVSAAPGRADD